MPRKRQSPLGGGIRRGEQPLSKPDGKLSLRLAPFGERYRVYAVLTTHTFKRHAVALLRNKDAADHYACDVQQRHRDGLDPLAGMDIMQCYALECSRDEPRPRHPRPGYWGYGAYAGAGYPTRDPEAAPAQEGAKDAAGAAVP